jgi:hypothetical protein
VKRTLGLLAVPVLLLAACGGDDDDAGSAADTSTAVTASESSDDSDDDDGGTDADSAWCGLATEIEETNSDLESMDFTDPESVEATYQRFVDQLQDVRDQAPDAIREDVEQLADFSQQFFDALADVDFNFVDVDLAAIEEMSDEMEAASNRIQQYNEDVCGIESDVDDTTDDTTGTSDDDSGFDTSEGTLREQLVEQLTATGFTDEEANCLVDVLDFNDPAVQSGDQSAIIDAFSECDIDLTRLTELGGG